MAHRRCTGCGCHMSAHEPRKRTADGGMLCKACTASPRGGFVSAGSFFNEGAAHMAHDDLSGYEDEMRGSEGRALGQHLWEGLAKAQGYQDADHMTMARQHHQMGVLHERYGDNNGGTHGVDAGHDPFYEVHHPTGFTARTFGGPYLEIGHRATPAESHDVIDVSEPGEHGEGSGRGIHPAMTNGSPEGNHHMIARHLDAWVKNYGQDVADNSPPIKRHLRVRGLTTQSSIQVVGHDSGDGETIYHCPFCGSGQVIARSDRTIECEFCHTCFTVQVQPQFPAFPQTINGQPVQVPGMPGQIGPGADPMGQGGPPMADDGSEMGDDPAMGNGVAGEAPPPDDGGNPFVDDQGDSAEDGEDDGSDDDDSDDKGGNPFAKKKSALMFTTSAGALVDSQSYIKHLALRHSGDDREAVLARVRGSRG